MDKLINWIWFKQLMKRWNLDEYELHQIIERRLIDPYVEYYFNPSRLPDMPIHPFHVDSLQIEQDISIDKLVFKIEDVERYESHNEKKKTKYPNTLSPISTGAGICWKDVIITFLGDDEILVQYGTDSCERKFYQAGFGDGRNGRPIKSWMQLRDAASTGQIPFNINDRRYVEKTVQTINKKFADLFPDLKHRPINLNDEKNGYSCSFQIK